MDTRSSKILRIGMAQIDCKVGDVNANLQKVLGLIEAYRDKVDLLIFPELSLTGYSVGKNFHKCAMRLEDPRLKLLMKQAGNMTVGVGLIEETPSFRFYNSLVFIRASGITHTHRKIYLPNYDIFEEKKYFSVGAKFNCFDHTPFRIAPFICGDAWNPALVHIAAADEANVLIISACSPAHSLGGRLSNQANWQRLIRFYATTYGSYVIFVNRTGRERGLNFYGRSALINPFGEMVSSARGDKEGVTIGTVNLSLVRKARTILNTIRDENLEFIQKELSKIIANKDYL